MDEFDSAPVESPVIESATEVLEESNPQFSKAVDKISLWRHEQQERIAKKDQEEEILKSKWKEDAKKELEDWYKKRDEQLKKTHLNHK